MKWSEVARLELAYPQLAEPGLGAPKLHGGDGKGEDKSWV